MIDILLSGVGGQGTVLAAKVLAQAAENKGWQVRTAETIGMAQRGGSVVSHVRMGNNGEEVFAPLVAQGSAQLIIAFEPAEAARVVSYLAPGATIVTATTALQPVTAALSTTPYRAATILDQLAQALDGIATFVPVNDEALCRQLNSRKVLNTVLLACALTTGCLPLDLNDLRSAVQTCVKPQFVQLNLSAIDIVEAEIAPAAPIATMPT